MTDFTLQRFYFRNGQRMDSTRNPRFHVHHDKLCLCGHCLRIFVKFDAYDRHVCWADRKARKHLWKVDEKKDITEEEREWLNSSIAGMVKPCPKFKRRKILRERKAVKRILSKDGVYHHSEKCSAKKCLCFTPMETPSRRVLMFPRRITMVKADSTQKRPDRDRKSGLNVHQVDDDDCDVGRQERVRTWLTTVVSTAPDNDQENSNEDCANAN